MYKSQERTRVVLSLAGECRNRAERLSVLVRTPRRSNGSNSAFDPSLPKRCRFFSKQIDTTLLLAIRELQVAE